MHTHADTAVAFVFQFVLMLLTIRSKRLSHKMLGIQSDLSMELSYRTEMFFWRVNVQSLVIRQRHSGTARCVWWSRNEINIRWILWAKLFNLRSNRSEQLCHRLSLRFHWLGTFPELRITDRNEETRFAFSDGDEWKLSIKYQKRRGVWLWFEWTRVALVLHSHYTVHGAITRIRFNNAFKITANLLHSLTKQLGKMPDMLLWSISPSIIIIFYYHHHWRRHTKCTRFKRATWTMDLHSNLFCSTQRDMHTLTTRHKFYRFLFLSSINLCCVQNVEAIVWVREELLFKLQTLYTWIKRMHCFAPSFGLVLVLIFCFVLVLLHLRSRRRYSTFLSFNRENAHSFFMIIIGGNMESQHVSHCVSAFGDFWKSTESDYVSSRCRRYRFYVRFFPLVRFRHSSETNIGAVIHLDVGSVSKRAVSVRTWRNWPFHGTSQFPARGTCLFLLNHIPVRRRRPSGTCDSVERQVLFAFDIAEENETIEQQQNMPADDIWTQYSVHRVDLCLLIPENMCISLWCPLWSLLLEIFPSANSFDWVSVFICRQQTPREKQFNNWIAACGKSALWLDMWMLYVCVCVYARCCLPLARSVQCPICLVGSE